MNNVSLFLFLLQPHYPIHNSETQSTTTQLNFRNTYFQVLLSSIFLYLVMVTVTTSGLVDRKSLEHDGALNGIIDFTVRLSSQSVSAYAVMANYIQYNAMYRFVVQLDPFIQILLIFWV